MKYLVITKYLVVVALLGTIGFAEAAGKAKKTSSPFVSVLSILLKGAK